MIRLYRFIYFFLISAVIVVSTLFLSDTAYNDKDLLEMKFGLPLSFVTQDMTKYNPTFPVDFHLTSPLENALYIDWSKLIINILIVFIITQVASRLLNLLRKR